MPAKEVFLMNLSQSLELLIWLSFLLPLTDFSVGTHLIIVFDNYKFVERHDFLSAGRWVAKKYFRTCYLLKVH